MGQQYLRAGLEMYKQFPLATLKRQVWKHDGAGGEKDTWSFIVFICYFAHYLLLDE